jgi:hypothetical protein
VPTKLAIRLRFAGLQVATLCSQFDTPHPGGVPTMPRYLIEVPHEPDKLACLRAIEIFLKTGSHYLTHCDWGCGDGEHKAWITIETDSKDDALRIIPPAFRADAKIVRVGKLTMEQVESMLAQHKP